jgi:RNA polymerase sigma-70 factor (ECF subfamily)
MAHGDREALAELYDRHAAALYAHAVALARSQPDAEDLVQGLFVKLAALGVALLGVRSAGAYLHKMLRAAFLDGERHRIIAGEQPIEGAERAEAQDRPPVDRLAVDAAMARLPVEQREVVWLHAVEGLTFREIGAITGTPMWTAASRYRLGVQRLRRLIG